MADLSRDEIKERGLQVARLYDLAEKSEKKAYKADKKERLDEAAGYLAKSKRLYKKCLRTCEENETFDKIILSNFKRRSLHKLNIVEAYGSVREANEFRRQANTLYKIAVKYYDQVVKHDPKDSDAHYMICNIWICLGDYEVALENVNKAIDLNPDFTEAYNSRGIIRGHFREYELALADFNKALTLEPNSPRTVQNINAVLELRYRHQSNVDNV